MVLRGDLDAVVDGADGGADGAGGVFGEVGSAGGEGVFVHPDDHGAEVGGAVGFGGGGVGGDEHFAAGEVDLVGEFYGDGLGVGGGGKIAVPGDDALDGGGFAGGEGHDSVAGAEDAAGDLAGEAAEVEVGALDELDGEAEGLGVGVGGREGDGFEEVEEGGAVVPGHVGAGSDNVVAFEGADGDEGDGGQVEAGCEGAELLLDGAEGGLGEVDEVHFVDGCDDVGDAEEAGDGGVAAGLRE